ncbi:MAG: VTT domain-containing protein [Clostridia bacterium]|nr:VTT domain-containing protein [Deltaproteobacteria bacterium]
MLIDAEAYYAAFVSAAKKAERSILIVGWDLHSQVELVRPAPGDMPYKLGPFLDALAEAKRNLRVHVLAWDYAVLFASKRDVVPHVRFGAGAHRRVFFEVDAQHPPGASHHQKIVVIDDQVAFIGGLDLTEARWDRPRHRHNDPQRVDHNGKAYAAFHDAQVVVEGEAAKALGDLARERWFRATNKRLKAPFAGGDRWPSDVVADAFELYVGLARTEGAFAGRPQIQEVERLYLDAIAAATERIYIENQYLTSRTITEALVKRLKAAQGPEVVLVLPQVAAGWLDENTMHVLRSRVLGLLQRSDAHRRLGVFYPQAQGFASPCVNLHAKVMVVDDAFARVGSSNLSNRSMGLDTECDLAWEGDTPEHTASIRLLRHRLLAEHLGIEPQAYARAEIEHGMLGAIRKLGTGETRLVPLEVAEWETTEEILPHERLIDPASAVDVDLILETLVPNDRARSSRLAHYRLILVVAVLVGLASAWRWSPLHAYLDPRYLAEVAAPLREEPWAWAAAVLAYVAAGLLSFPLILLVLQSGLVFGAERGIPIAYAGAMLSSATTFSIGRLIGRGFVGKITGKRLRVVMSRLRDSGVLAITMVRILPIAPFSIINIVAGASGVGFSRFMVGTLVGMSPSIIGVNLFGASLFEALATRDPWRLVMSVGIGVVLVGGGIWLRKKLERRGRLVPASVEPAG